MYKYDSLIEYFTGDDEDGLGHNDIEYMNEPYMERKRGVHERKMAHDFITKFQNLFKPFIRKREGKPSKSNIMAKYSAENKIQEKKRKMS